MEYRERKRMSRYFQQGRTIGAKAVQMTSVLLMIGTTIAGGVFA